jgi:probable F420-dependent oxidoreductase
MKSIRFGLFASNYRIPYQHWLSTLPKIEKLEYSTVFQQDHFTTDGYEPTVMLASAAAITKTLNIGSLVFAVDFRHPAILAKVSAALHLISNGRLEFGMGAGYQPKDYEMTGIPYYPANVRVDRLEEALEIIKMMWTQDKTSYKGKHYQIKEIEKAGDLQEDNLPKIMIGGGGKRMLKLAGRHADIVGIVPRWKGSWSQEVRAQTLDSIIDKIKKVKTAASEFGRNPDEIEFQLLYLWTEITDNPKLIIAEIAKTYGISREDMANSEYLMVGSSSDIREKIETIHQETGINYFVVSPKMNQIEAFSKQIIKPLLSNP